MAFRSSARWAALSSINIEERQNTSKLREGRAPPTRRVYAMEHQGWFQSLPPHLLKEARRWGTPQPSSLWESQTVCRKLRQMLKVAGLEESLYPVAFMPQIIRRRVLKHVGASPSQLARVCKYIGAVHNRVLGYAHARCLPQSAIPARCSAPHRGIAPESSRSSATPLCEDTPPPAGTADTAPFPGVTSPSAGSQSVPETPTNPAKRAKRVTVAVKKSLHRLRGLRPRPRAKPH